MTKKEIIARLGVLEKQLFDTLNLVQVLKSDVLDSIADDEVDSSPKG